MHSDIKLVYQKIKISKVMKKLFILLVGTMCAYNAAAQSIGITGLSEGLAGLPTVNVESLDSLATTVTKAKQYFLPLQDNRNVYMYPTLDMCTSLSQGRSEAVSVINDNETEKKDVSTGVGLTFGSTLVFVPGKKADNRLKVNSMGFAYSFGFIAALEKSEKYDLTCNFLLKAGVEIGNQHAMGVGVDVLAGYGKGKGDLFFYEGIIEKPEPIKTMTYTSWAPQFGAQIWFRTGLLREKLQGIEILTCFQFLYVKNPNLMTAVSNIHRNVWKPEVLSVSIMVRYPF